MTKNILVVDESGNKYGNTYPKRAKGLVKNGRARFVDDTTICLACPPIEKLEDETMFDQIKNSNLSQSGGDMPNLSINYILAQMERIAADTKYIESALEKLGNMALPDAPVSSNMSGHSAAQAIGNIIVSRETTNQRLLQMYERMYDDLSKGQETL